MGLIFLLIFFFIQFSSATDSYNVASGIQIDLGIKVIYSTFNGNTTDFLRMNDENLSSILNLTLEKLLFGKIIFTQIVNLTDDLENNTIDFDSYADISNNFISINTLHLPSLNKSAIIKLHSLSFGNPRIVKDGEICSSPDCVITSYLNGSIEFTVSQISNNFSTEETPVEQGVVQASQGSSSGSPSSEAKKTILNFTIDKSILDIKIKQGERINQSMFIKNTGNQPLLFTITTEGKDDLMLIRDKIFSLNPNETKEIKIIFFAAENNIPDINTAKILVNSLGITKEVDVILEVLEKKPLFDIISSLDKQVLAKNDKISAEIEMTNMGDDKKVDVTLEYFIEDFSSNKIKIGEETLAVSGSKKITRNFNLPENLSLGNYLFYVRLNYNGNIATSKNSFEIVEKDYSNKYWIYILTVIIIGVLIAILLILSKPRKKQKIKKRNRKR